MAIIKVILRTSEREIFKLTLLKLTWNDVGKFFFFAVIVL